MIYLPLHSKTRKPSCRKGDARQRRHSKMAAVPRWPIRWWKNFGDTFSRFDTIHACDGRTDRQTELAWHIRAIAYMLSRVKIHIKRISKFLHTNTSFAYNYCREYKPLLKIT